MQDGILNIDVYVVEMRTFRVFSIIHLYNMLQWMVLEGDKDSAQLVIKFQLCDCARRDLQLVTAAKPRNMWHAPTSVSDALCSVHPPRLSTASRQLPLTTQFYPENGPEGVLDAFNISAVRDSDGVQNTRLPFEVDTLVCRVFISLIVDGPLMILLQISTRSLL